MLGPASVDVHTKVLSMRAIVFDVVAESSVPFENDWVHLGQILEMVYELDMSYYTGEGRLEVLMKTLLAQNFRHRVPEPEDQIQEKMGTLFVHFLLARIAVSVVFGPETGYLPLGSWIEDPLFMTFRGRSLISSEQPNLTGYIARIRNLDRPGGADDDDEIINEEAELLIPTYRFARIVRKAVALRRVMRTAKKNCLGLMPKSAQVGDELWFLQGAKVPFILRRMEIGNHELIGEAYIHGYMQGEIFTRDGLRIEEAVTVNLQ